MEHFIKPLDRSESDAMVARILAHFERHGFGFWAVEAPNVAALVGMVGLAIPPFETHFTPCVEIGWRLAREHWGKGYASEAARASLHYGFEQLGLGEIVAFTVPRNVRSRAVMERIGMTRSPADDFDHPSLPEGHPLRRHVLYPLCGELYTTLRRRAIILETITYLHLAHVYSMALESSAPSSQPRPFRIAGHGSPGSANGPYQ